LNPLQDWISEELLKPELPCSCSCDTGDAPLYHRAQCDVVVNVHALMMPLHAPQTRSVPYSSIKTNAMTPDPIFKNGFR
jgi:hypothetical protein